MTLAARSLGAALGIICSTVLVGAPAIAAGLLMRLDGGDVPAVSTILLVAVAVHGVFALSLLWSVARDRTNGARTRYWWWIGSAIGVVTCMVLVAVAGWRPSVRAMLLVGLGLVGAAMTGREILIRSRPADSRTRS